MNVIKIFNYLPYKYKDLNPVAKTKLVNLLFSNRELNGQKLHLEAISAFDKLKRANRLV